MTTKTHPAFSLMRTKLSLKPHSHRVDELYYKTGTKYLGVRSSIMAHVHTASKRCFNMEDLTKTQPKADVKRGLAEVG